MTAHAKAAPNPIWNEALILKLPHPAAVLTVSLLLLDSAHTEVHAEP